MINKFLKQYQWEYLLLAACSVMLFIPALHFPFFFLDDATNITNNPRLHFSLTNLGLIWSGSKTPVPQTVWLLISSITSKNSPVLFYIANIFLHFINGLMIFHLGHLILSRHFVKTKPELIKLLSLFSAFLFIVHPLQVQTVTWPSELRGILATTLLLSSLFFYNRTSDSQGQLNIAHFLAFFILYVLALLTKPIVGSFFIFLFIYSIFVLKEKISLPIIKNLPPLLFTLFMTVFHIKDEIAQNQQVSSFATQIMTAFYTNVFYLKKFFLPFNLEFIYAVNRSNFISYINNNKAIFSAEVIVVLLVVIIFVSKKQFHFLFAALMSFILLILPTSGIADFNYQMTTLTADRYVYTGIAALCLFLSAIALLVYERFLENRMKINFLLIPIALFFFIQSVSTVYKRSDIESLLLRASGHNEFFTEVYLNYLIAHNKLPKAVTYMNDNLTRISPGFVSFFDQKQKTISSLNILPVITSLVDISGKNIQFYPAVFHYFLKHQKILAAYNYLNNKSQLLSIKDKEHYLSQLNKAIIDQRNTAYVYLGDYYSVNNEPKNAMNYFLTATKGGFQIQDKDRINFIINQTKIQIDKKK